MKKFFLLFFIILFCVFFIMNNGNAATIDFEDLFEFESVTTQYQALGPTFTNAIVLTAGSLLNEFEFPPFSGSNVISDDFGPIEITFSTPIIEIEAYLTYLMPVTMNVYDTSLNLVGSETSDFFSNMALSGDLGSSPNESFSLAYAGGISSIEIIGDFFGGSYVLDDLSFTESAAPIPEPSTFLLAIAALMILGTKKFFIK